MRSRMRRRGLWPRALAHAVLSASSQNSHWNSITPSWSEPAPADKTGSSGERTPRGNSNSPLNVISTGYPLVSFFRMRTSRSA